MTFLALILALLLAYAWDFGPSLHRDDWFQRWLSRVASLGLGPVPRVLLAVLLPFLLAQWILDALEGLMFGLVWIVAAAGLLLYAFGRGNLGAEQEKYRSQCRREDFEGAYLYGAGELAWLDEGENDAARSPAEVHIGMQRGFLYQAQQRWFAVLFYFLLLGPAGALAYRLLQLASNRDTAAILHIADWLPARLVAATFTVMGNFVDSADELLAGVLDAKMPAPAMLYSVANAATGEDRVATPETGFGVHAARQNELFAALVRRSSIAWIVVISLAVVLN